MSTQFADVERAEQVEQVEQVEAKPRRSANVIGVVIVAALLFLGAIFAFGLANQRQTQPRSGLAPDFTLTLLDGSQVRLSDLRGQVVVVNFWASWCAPCRQEAAELEAAYQQYKGKGVEFLGIAYTDTERNAKAYLAEFGITYKNGLDYKTAISEQYRITGVPETFIIDRKGEISDFVMVPLTLSQLNTLIERALAR